MKTRHLLSVTMLFLFVAGWQAPVGAQDIPVNYIQNPNMEHDLNAIFWYGSCCDAYGTNGVANFPEHYRANLGDGAHSGNWVFSLPAGSYVWVSYPVRGHEEKKFKASFWYRGYLDGYWNFIYRDVGMTEEDLPPALAEYVGADTAYHELGGQDAMRFVFGGEDGWTEDWTYFEFVWDFPGTIPGWGNTSMWHTPHDTAYVDDLYYGEWYDAKYMGEEPFGFINGDFEKTNLNGEWLYNLASWDAQSPQDFLVIAENHTESGLQSIALGDYMVVDTSGGTTDTSMADRNITYYLPALGAEGKNMEMSFWYKGNAVSATVEFYDDYGVTTDDLPLPDGASLVTDKPIHDISYQLEFDDESTMDVTVLGNQDFEDPDDLALPGASWLWSGSDHYTWADWSTGATDNEMHSGSTSLWVPGDPNWTGIEGTVPGIIDDTSYVFSFWYKGKMQLDIYLGESLKYDLEGDPDGLVPDDATADAAKIHWDLDAADWTMFVFPWNQGSWLADSAVDEPAALRYQIIGTYTEGDAGYVDDVFYGMVGEYTKPAGTTFEFLTDTLSTVIPQVAAMWELPAVTEWTEWKVNWTNPSGDIGGNLTLILDNELTDNPDYLTVEKETFDWDNEGWTFLDDFYYGIDATSVQPVRKQLKELHLYPNPAVDILYLSIMDPLKEIRVFNSLGQLVISLDNPERKFSVSDLTPGMYMISVTDEQGNHYQKKFIKK